ncbi:sigma-70 family RNA polymerase sigma factor [uncultured Cetobacterium sp.]|uniref:sigma-70 family RNA polymerase sigma factor n=1 Tax=uncultured Cetobacterium sp. TaxID=527638 RepID=UPI002633488A|nr:sigma-70 family RNA polymerase sigma factor [uncultured Cetobacterium sp.]
MIEKLDIIRAKSGDEDSIEKIILEYQNFIYFKNKNLFLKGADKEDLIQEGLIGLIKAIKSYDEERNICFNTFASLCIRRQILTAVKKYNSEKNKNLNKAIQGGKYNESEEVIKYNYPSLNYYTPEQIYLGTELVHYLKKYMKENLSGLEKDIFLQMSKGYNYREIAILLDKDVKIIDNSMQRIRKKLLNYLEGYNKI